MCDLLNDVYIEYHRFHSSIQSRMGREGGFLFDLLALPIGIIKPVEIACILAAVIMTQGINLENARPHCLFIKI